MPAPADPGRKLSWIRTWCLQCGKLLHLHPCLRSGGIFPEGFRCILSGKIRSLLYYPWCQNGSAVNRRLLVYNPWLTYLLIPENYSKSSEKLQISTGQTFLNATIRLFMLWCDILRTVADQEYPQYSPGREILLYKGLSGLYQCNIRYMGNSLKEVKNVKTELFWCRNM